MLAALEPTTTVTTDSDVTVADRAAYELVLDPNDDASLIGQIRLAIDGETKMPLRVQIFNVKADLVFEVGYDSVSFTRPEDREFEFKAPPGTKVTEGEKIAPRTPDREGPRAGARGGRGGPEQAKIVGSGWSTVAVQKRRVRPTAASRASCRASSASCRGSAGTGARAGCWPGPPSPRC